METNLTIKSECILPLWVGLMPTYALCDGSLLMLLEKEILNAYNGRLLFDSKGPSYSEYVSYLQETRSNKLLNHWTQ